MVKIGVIENPLSDRNSKEDTTFEALCHDHADVHYARLDPFAALPDILRDFASRDVGLVVVAAGDGTTQAILTQLFEVGVYESPPTLALLARGRTNLIPGDVGVRGRDTSALSRLIALARDRDLATHTVSRPLLRLDNIAETTPQIGTFLGGGAIYRAIETCMQSVHPTGLNPALANFLTLSGVILRWLARGRRDDGIFHGDAMTLTPDEGAALADDYLLVLATTLDRLIFGTRPYWGDQSRGLRYTAVRYPPQRLMRNLPAIFSSDPKRGPSDDSYLSGSANTLALRMDCPFMLDGQAFTPCADRPLLLSTAGHAQFVRV